MANKIDAYNYLKQLLDGIKIHKGDTFPERTIIVSPDLYEMLKEFKVDND